MQEKSNNRIFKQIYGYNVLVELVSEYDCSIILYSIHLIQAQIIRILLAAIKKLKHFKNKKFLQYRVNSEFNNRAVSF